MCMNVLCIECFHMRVVCIMCAVYASVLIWCMHLCAYICM